MGERFNSKGPSHFIFAPRGDQTIIVRDPDGVPVPHAAISLLQAARHPTFNAPGNPGFGFERIADHNGVVYLPDIPTPVYFVFGDAHGKTARQVRRTRSGVHVRYDIVIARPGFLPGPCGSTGN